MNLTRSIGCMLLILLCSCNQNTVYEQLDTNFSDNRWMKNDTRTYNFTIAEAARNYDVVLHFAHSQGYQFASVPLTVVIENPDKTVTNKTITLDIVAEDGKDKGECAGDYCDLYYTFITNEQLAAGPYKLSISHSFQGDYLPNILGVGIEVIAAGD